MTLFSIAAPKLLTPFPPFPAIEGEFTPGQAGDSLGAIGNGTGWPAISVHNGFTPGGLPTGLQFMGNAYEENGILSIASAYQSLTDWHQQHPADFV